LSDLALGENNVGLIVFVAIVQFPVYVTVLATVRKEGLFRLVAAGLSAAHVIAATFAVAEFL
jgi:hypothetical protein